jgi:hypothetical protein
MHEPWASNVLLSNQKQISKAQGRNRFGTEKKQQMSSLNIARKKKKLEN